MNADRIAAVYRWIEYLAFGKALQRCRCAHLNRIPTASRVLILGEGDGRFLSELLKHLAPEARVDVIESSAKMIALAKRRVSEQACDRVQFLQHRYGEGRQSPAYDVIVTNFFLDCLSRSEANVLIKTIGDALQPGGIWIVGEFQTPERGMRRWHAHLWIQTMYRFFRITTGLKVTRVPAYAKMLRAASFTQRSKQEQRYGLIVSELWEKR